MTRVLASATVDLLQPGPVPIWTIRVWGQPPYDRERTYDIQAVNETAAAEQGIDNFVDEMQNLDVGDSDMDPANDVNEAWRELGYHGPRDRDRT